MNHYPALLILLPALAAIFMLWPSSTNNLKLQRYIAFTCFAVLFWVCASMISQMQLGAQIYMLGGWHPPFGIMLLADRLSILMVSLTVFLAFCALLYGVGADDKNGRFFYPLFMFQLMGINGAFLTGDIFNLFVFFEILLIASYALLIHGGGKEKTRSSVQYITLNLIGSALFLIGLGVIYGTLGTLNMADMASKVSLLPPQEQALAKAGGLLLLLVFGLKSAMLPLQFWLPKTYASAAAPVAALFAIMTKVGLYSIYRVFGGIFGDDAGGLANIATPWIWALGMGTLIFGMFGALAAPTLRLLTANMVIVSVGTLLLAFVINAGNSLGAGLFYLVHSTLICGALFLLADQIHVQRGPAQDRFVVSRPMQQGGLLGILFFISAVAVVGLPPLSGFIGKALVLQAVVDAAEQRWVWPAVLISSLIALVAFARAGTSLFWHLSGKKPGNETAKPTQLLAIMLLLAAMPVLTVFAGPITEYTEQAAAGIKTSNTQIQTLISDSGIRPKSTGVKDDD